MLSKIKLANKKAKREARRRLARQKAKVAKESQRVRVKRMRQLFMQGQKEHRAHKRAAGDYVDNLESELQNDQA